MLTRFVDFDSDGDLDAYYQATWFENTDGQGNFVSHRFTERQGVSSEVADLDGDGDLDIVTSEPRWYENLDGRGRRFEPRSFPDTTFAATRIRIQDVSGDGDNDVILFHGERVTWYENHGAAAGFQFHELSFGDLTQTVTDVTDLDLDGDLDLALFERSNGVGSVSVAINDGQGQYRLVTIAQDDPGDPFYRSNGNAHFADVDGDGLEDVIREFLYDGIHYAWHRNDPDQPATLSRGMSMIYVGPFGEASRLLRFTDLDGDGDLDAAGVTDLVEKGILWENNNGNFDIVVRTPDFDIPFNVVVPFSDVGDANGDGVIDWMTAEFENGAPRWFDGTTGFYHVNELPMPLQPGDANIDYYFDEADLIQVAKQGRWQQTATWASGDWNGAPGGYAEAPPVGDGVFNEADFQAAADSNLYRTGPYAQTTSPSHHEREAMRLQLGDAEIVFRYDTATGELGFETDLTLSALQIHSVSGRLINAPAELTGAYDIASPHDLFRFDWNGFTSFELGPVLPAGLNWDEVFADLKIDGARVGGGDLGTVQFTCSECGLDVETVRQAVASNTHTRQTDLNGDGRTNEQDLRYLLHELLRSSLGDANLDGTFDSSDLVQVFQRGHYEDSMAGNSAWSDGDWNGDSEVTSADLMFAAQFGKYADHADVPRMIVDGPESFVAKRVGNTCGCSPTIDRQGVVDLDGDGDLDLLVSEYRAATVAWYENLDGLGTYGEQRVISDQVERIHPAIPVDVDGDGDQDIVVASVDFGSPGTILWYENVGGVEMFRAAPQAIDTARGAYRLASGDLDSDGDLDLVIGGSFIDPIGEITWYENQNEGQFTKRATLEFGPENAEVAVVDMDADGDLDIFSGHFHGFLWYRNNGTAEFEAMPGVAAQGMSRFHLGDVNGDGLPDVLGSSQRSAWFRNTAVAFEEMVLMLGPQEPDDAEWVDIDTDGDLDIAFARQAAWLENTDGLGAFDQVHPVSIMLQNSPRFGDLDRDGDQDWIDVSTWYENSDGVGRFRVGESIDQSSVDPRNIDVGDLDGDNDLDIVSGAWHGNVYGEFRFDTRPLAETSLWTTAHTADLDADGDLDAIIHYQSDLYWRENENGEALFGERKYILQPTHFDRIHSIVFDDVDLDGDLDIIAGINSRLTWFENQDGRGRFERNAETILEPGNVEAVEMADINGDGLRDLLSSHGWYPKQSTGGFGERIAFPNGVSAADLLLAYDMDGDGDQDVIGGGNGLHWFENLANQGLAPSRTLRPGTSPTSVDAVDLDDDGDIDLVFSDWSGEIGWLERTDGAEVEFNERTLLTGERAFIAVAADLDDDGDIDVLAGSEGGVTWLENQRQRFI